MASSHDSSSHDSHEPQEDPIRTPEWMPILGLGLLMAGALAVYLFISPGVMAGGTTSAADAGADGSAEQAAPAAPEAAH